jgi:hypothetical protein
MDHVVVLLVGLDGFVLLQFGDDRPISEEEQYWWETIPRLFMRAMLDLMLHLGGVGECVRLIWE